MLKYLLFSIATASFLAGCSSIQTAEQPYEPPYCFTDETITTVDGVVSSETKVQCSDRPRVEHFVQDIGVAKRCKHYTLREELNGEEFYDEGIQCQGLDGRWITVNPRGAY